MDFETKKENKYQERERRKEGKKDREKCCGGGANERKVEGQRGCVWSLVLNAINWVDGLVSDPTNKTTQLQIQLL